MLIVVAPPHALAYGGAPAPAAFNAAGYNTGVYGWKSGGYEPGNLSSAENRKACHQPGWAKDLMGPNNSWAPCQMHDQQYNAWNDLDDSPVSFHTTEPVDVGNVDGWLANVGGGIYKSKPTQLLRMFAR